jgi:hypothetical protein
MKFYAILYGKTAKKGIRNMRKTPKIDQNPWILTEILDKMKNAW